MGDSREHLKAQVDAEPVLGTCWAALGGWLVLAAGTANARPIEEGPLAGPTTWGLATLADCEAPDGSTFTTEVVSLPSGPLRFVQLHPEGRAEMLLVPEADGARERVLVRDGDSGSWSAGADGMASFLRGHDVHRLFLEAAEESPGGVGPESLTRTPPPGLGGGEVTISFADPRAAITVALPHVVEFLQDGERFRYRFRSVLAFRLAPGVELPGEPQLLFERLGDLHRITLSHERVMQAHRDGDLEALVADQAEVGVLVGRRGLGDDTRDDTRRRLASYLERTSFERYADVVAPVVAISGDGSLAWLACEMEAVGAQRTESGAEEPLSFAYSWVELFAKRGDRWLRTGNASSERR